jgi:alpha-galactosidase
MGKILTKYQLGEYQQRGFRGFRAVDDFTFKVNWRSGFERTSKYQTHTMHFRLRCAILFLLILGHTFAADVFVNTLENGKRWAVGNDMVSRTVSFSSADGLRTESLKHLVTGTHFTTQSAGNVEFSFEASGRHVDGHSKWTLTGANTVALVSGKALRVQLRDERDGLEVAVFYAAYDDEPAVRQWLQIKNTGRIPITLSRLAFVRMDASPGNPADVHVMSGYGAVPHESFMTGRVSDAAIFLCNSRTHEGVTVVNEAPGYLKRTEIADSWHAGLSLMYDTDLFPFERSVASGETFETAKGSLVFFKDGAGLSDSHWAVPGYLSRIVMRRGAGYRPLWLYNTWEPFLRNINSETVRQLVPIASRMGMDVFTIDDGWQAVYGSNEDNRRAFPEGIEGVRKLLEHEHMGLGLWVPLAAVGTQTAAYHEHPEWTCQDTNHHPKTTNTEAGPQAVMCLGSPYRDLALQRLNDLIEHYRPRYIKVDLTTVFNAYGEQPGCHAPGHYHRTWAESLDRIYEGLEYIGRGLHEQHPEVIVDYTFELWGEKHLIDAALLQCADVDWLSNVSDATPTDAGTTQGRMLLYQRALSIPSETMLIGNLRAATRPVEERFGVAIGSGPVLLGDLRDLTAADQHWWGEQVRWFRQLRERARLSDSFFPLGTWQQPGTGPWDGFARLSRTSDGIVVLFRNVDHVQQATVRVIAPPNARYEVRSVLDGRALGMVTAQELYSGWTTPFDAKHAVTVLQLNRR